MSCHPASLRVYKVVSVPLHVTLCMITRLRVLLAPTPALARKRKHNKLMSAADFPVVLAPQLYPPCKAAIHMCNARIPLISDIVCQGAFDYCQMTQARVLMDSILAALSQMYNLLPRHGASQNRLPCWEAPRPPDACQAFCFTCSACWFACCACEMRA